MRWTPGGISGDVEDRRGQDGFRMGGPQLGLGGTLLLLLLSLIFGRNFLSFFSGSPGAAPAAGSASRSAVESPDEAKLVEFVSFVLDDAQTTWDRVLPRETGMPYRHAKLVLFRDATQSACGMAQTATGPFYCPADEKVYIDLSFYDELKNRFGAPGEFAQAYVLAHEIGHHVQETFSGSQMRCGRCSDREPAASNPLSVRLELQADCLAGVWGNSTAQRRPHRSERCRGGNASGGRGGRRSAPEDGAWIRESGIVHPWIFGAANGVVPARPERRPYFPMQYVRSWELIPADGMPGQRLAFRRSGRPDHCRERSACDRGAESGSRAQGQRRGGIARRSGNDGRFGLFHPPGACQQEETGWRGQDSRINPLSSRYIRVKSRDPD